MRISDWSSDVCSSDLSVQVEQRLDALDDGRIDLAIRMGTGPWPGLHAEALMDDALYPVMSPALWQTSGRPSKPAQLAGPIGRAPCRASVCPYVQISVVALSFQKKHPPPTPHHH